MISQQTLQKFKEIFEREIGPMPDEQVLLDSACDLLTLFDNTYRPIKKEWLGKFAPGQKEMVENGQFIAPGQKINQENQENNSPRAKITGNNR